MGDSYIGLDIEDFKDGQGFSNRMTPMDALRVLAARLGLAVNSLEFSVVLDEKDPLNQLRSEFLFPVQNGKPVVYFVGNSLGLQPRGCAQFIQSELESWASRGVNGHFEGSNPWLNYDDLLVESMARLVGAHAKEVAVMNSLTVNLHLLMIRFFNKSTTADFRRCKILIEARSFPSDFYALESQLRMRGLDPRECLVEVHPRAGEHILRTEDVEAKISELGSELALVVFSGVQFYSGQLFDIEAITAAAHRAGAYAVWDLAHAAGSVDLQLHDWKVDGACWCTYKYLNSGPGGVGGFFIHQDHFNKDVDRLLGWWSHDVSSRFEMSNQFEACVGANEFRLSNVPILSSAALLASLSVFDKTSMRMLRAKSMLLTGYLEYLLEALSESVDAEYRFTIISGSSRGPQLSLLFNSDERAKEISKRLEENGVMIDYRKPGLVRAAPAPLYCSFSDVVVFRNTLERVIMNNCAQ